MDELGIHAGDVRLEHADRLLEQLLAGLVAFQHDDLEVVRHGRGSLARWLCGRRRIAIALRELESPSRRGRCQASPTLVAACVVGGGLLAAAPGAAAAGLNWQPCAFADAGSQCATAHVPRDYDHPNGDKLSIDVAKSPATGPARRSARCSSTSAARARFAAPYVEFVGHDLFPVLNERFDIVGHGPARHRHRPRQRELHLLQHGSGDGRLLLDAVHDAVQPRRRPADQEGQALRLELHQEQRAEPAPARVDGRRRPRPRLHAQGGRRRQDDLPRVLLRDVPRRDLREHVPGQDAGRRARRRAQRQDLHQPPDAEPAPADERRRARDRPHLAGLRA